MFFIFLYRSYLSKSCYNFVLYKSLVCLIIEKYLTNSSVDKANKWKNWMGKYHFVEKITSKKWKKKITLKAKTYHSTKKKSSPTSGKTQNTSFMTCYSIIALVDIRFFGNFWFSFKRRSTGKIWKRNRYRR